MATRVTHFTYTVTGAILNVSLPPQVFHKCLTVKSFVDSVLCHDCEALARSKLCDEIHWSSDHPDYPCMGESTFETRWTHVFYFWNCEDLRK